MDFWLRFRQARLSFRTPKRDPRNVVYLHFGLIAVSGTLVFFPILNNGFIYRSDDAWQLIKNPNVCSLSTANVVSFFTSYFNGQYSPLNTLVYAFLVRLFGLNPLPFHLFSLLLHISNSILIYIFGVKLFNLASRGWDISQRSFLFIAIMYCIHPLQVEAVSWIAASKVILYSFFFLNSIVSYLQYLKARRPLWYYLSILCFILAFLSKEQSLVLPFCLIIIDAYVGSINRGKILNKIPFLLFFMFFAYVSWKAQSGSGVQMVASANYYTVYERVCLASYSLLQYTFRFLFPINLGLNYPFPFLPSQPMSASFTVYPILILIYLVAFYKQFKGKLLVGNAWFFGISFFLINIVVEALSLLGQG
jgi:hypothetical protein